MAFMVPVIERGAWYVVECADGGSEVLPVDVVGKVAGDLDAFRMYCESEPVSVEHRVCWGSRLSAPGYMDCTEWTLHDTEAEARADLRETHDVCPFTGDNLPPEDGDDCDCMRCVDAEPSPGSCTEAHRLCSHDGASCATRCNCGQCFDEPEGDTDGGT